MTGGVRLLTAIIVGAVTLLLSLAVLGAVGLGRVAYIQIPVALFCTALAVWPLIARLLGYTQPRAFVEYLAYNAAVMLVFGLLMWTAKTWNNPQPLIDDLDVAAVPRDAPSGQ